MKKETKNLLKILAVISALLLTWFISEKFFPSEPIKPSYESYEQGDRLKRIRQGLTNK